MRFLFVSCFFSSMKTRRPCTQMRIGMCRLLQKPAHTNPRKDTNYFSICKISVLDIILLIFIEVIVLEVEIICVGICILAKT